APAETPREQQDITLPLVIPFGMEMFDIFVQRSPQRALAKEDHLAQALRREPCGPTDDRSRRAWLARRPRALAALSTWLSGGDFRRPDIHSAPAAPGPSSP